MKNKSNSNNNKQIFYNKNGSKKIPEEKVPHKCLSIIILESFMHMKNITPKYF